MESITGSSIPEDCKTGWLMVESDFSARLIKPEQLKYALQCAGRNPSEKAVERYWSQCGGSMSFDQFTLVMKREKKTTMSDLMKAFRKIDLNGDGYITVQELHKTLTKRGEKMTHDEVQAIIEEADENGDGKLDYAEFCHMLMNTSEQCVKASRSIKSSKTGSRSGQSSFKTGQTSGSKRRREQARPYPAYQQVSSFTREKNSENFLYDNQQRSVSNHHRRRLKTTNENSHLPIPRSNHLLEHSEHDVQVAPLSTGSGVVTMETGGHQIESTKVTDFNKRDVTEVREKVNGQTEVAGDLNVPSQVGSNKSTPTGDENGDAGTNLTKKLLSDPFDVPSSSVSKLPPLTKTGALPPLLPPIGGKKKEDDETIPNASLQVNSGHEGSDQQQVATVTKTESSPDLTDQSTVKDEPKVTNGDDGPDLTDQSTIKDEPKVTNGDDASPLGSNSSLKDTTDNASSHRDSQSKANEAPVSQETKESSNTTTQETVEETTNSSRDKVESSNTNATQNSPKHHPPNEEPDDNSDNTQEDKDRDSMDSEGSKLASSVEGVSGEEGQQTDHLDNQKKKMDETKASGLKGEEVAQSKMAPPSSVVAMSPKKPKNLKSWNSITGKGCFYLDLEDETSEGQDDEEEGVVRCHHYRLKVPSPTNLWIEMGVASPGNLATDVLLFVFRTNENEDPEELITYTQHKVDQRWVCRLDLDVGTYALIPFTSGCHLKPREDDEIDGGGVAILSQKGGGGVALSEGCREALEEIFHRMDLDSNGYLGRTEFDFFQERTSGEICDDESWKVIQDNFEMTADDELTLKGFIDLHMMTAEDEEGGEDEVWDILDALGYNKQLLLDQACPFHMDVYTEDCEGEIEIVDLLPFSSIVDPALCHLVVDRGVCEPVKDGEGNLNTYTFTTPHLSTIAVENKSSKKMSVQLDVSKNANCVFSRESSVHVLEIPPQSTRVGFHIVLQEPNETYSIKCIASKILY